MKNVETVPNPPVIHESHQERPPKSVLEPPKRSRHDPTYVMSESSEVVSGGMSAATESAPDVLVASAPVEEGGGGNHQKVYL